MMVVALLMHVISSFRQYPNSIIAGNCRTISKTQCKSSAFAKKDFVDTVIPYSSLNDSQNVTLSSIPSKNDILLSKWGISLTDSEDVKTGAELRKERKRNSLPKISTTLKKKPIQITKDSNRTVSRFRLGNGLDAISPSNLIEAVQSTAPYLFPEFQIKLVMDDDEDDDYDDLKDANGLNQSNNYATKSVNFSDPFGWHNLLLSSKKLTTESQGITTASQRSTYFSLCLASHFATVATFVPTDVDSKIRGHCWYSIQST